MKSTSTGAAVAAAAILGAIGLGALGTGIASGAPRAAAKPATFQMYANVDQLGDLGSNVGAKNVKVTSNEYAFFYAVTFNRPIGKCAAQAQPGYAGGNLQSGWYISQVVAGGPDTFNVNFLKPTGTGTESAFMLTVTCPS